MYVASQQLHAADIDIEGWSASNSGAYNTHYKKHHNLFSKKENKEKRRKLADLKNSVQTLEYQLLEAETKMDELRSLIQLLIK